MEFRTDDLSHQEPLFILNIPSPLEPLAPEFLTGSLPLESYTRNVPPHIRAARQLEKPERWVHYVITTGGPQPAEAMTFPLDYAHYLDRQLAPAADAILHALGTSLQKITTCQAELFD